VIAETVARLRREKLTVVNASAARTGHDLADSQLFSFGLNDQALRRIQRDIDLAEARLHRPA
jgi:hypothetical protein